MKPFLKWVGGKTQLLDKINEELPKEINNYHDIFLGGGSTLINILNSSIKINGLVYAYDYNKNLINLYNNIKNNVELLITYIDNYINIYNSINIFNGNKKPMNDDESKSSKESYYYYMRNRYNSIGTNNQENIEKSALFIILNKLCFRGIYRESSLGKFNVPFGNYKTPTVYDIENLKSLSQLFQNVIFQHLDFNISLNNVKENDFVYADPPYAPENNKSFVKYNKEGFTIEDNENLFNKLKSLDNIKSKFLMSNSNVDFVKDKFNNNKYKIIIVDARRAINSKNPESTTKEVLIKNY